MAEAHLRETVLSRDNDGYQLMVVVFHIFLLFTIFESKIPHPMNTFPEALRQEYQSPSLRIIPMSLENAICDSTIPGGNEDIGYEDWD